MIRNSFNSNHTKTVLIGLLLLLHCGVSVSFGQVSTDNPRRSTLDSLVHQSVLAYLQDKKAVGVSIAIVKNGMPYFYNYGETKAGNKQLPNRETIYEIGSITKTFTGVLLGKAILDKKIGLDDDIRKYLKDPFPNLSYQDTAIGNYDSSGLIRSFCIIGRRLFAFSGHVAHNFRS
jgi:serine-type D-Ala-D-Ala carboxypeptidase/endopeptidase